MLDTGDNPDAPAPREMIDLEVILITFNNTEACGGTLITERLLKKNLSVLNWATDNYKWIAHCALMSLKQSQHRVKTFLRSS